MANNPQQPCRRKKQVCHSNAEKECLYIDINEKQVEKMRQRPVAKNFRGRMRQQEISSSASRSFCNMVQVQSIPGSFYVRLG